MCKIGRRAEERFDGGFVQPELRREDGISHVFPYQYRILHIDRPLGGGRNFPMPNFKVRGRLTAKLTPAHLLIGHAIPCGIHGQHARHVFRIDIKKPRAVHPAVSRVGVAEYPAWIFLGEQGADSFDGGKITRAAIAHLVAAGVFNDGGMIPNLANDVGNGDVETG